MGSRRGGAFCKGGFLEQKNHRSCEEVFRHTPRENLAGMEKVPQNAESRPRLDREKGFEL